MLSKEKKRKLLGIGNVSFDVPLKNRTTLRIGGNAAAFMAVGSCHELTALARFCIEENIPWLCIGKGSNLLVSDHGFRGVAFSLSGVLAEIIDLPQTVSPTKRIVAGAGMSLVKLVQFCTEHELSGLEFAAGIPGTVGGAVIMNAGAWGGEMAQVVTAVEVTGANGSRWIVDTLDFCYRDWPEFHRLVNCELLAVSAVAFELKVAKRETIEKRCKELAIKRREVQKVYRPNAGSFFKNPPNESAGRLIDAAGCRGMRVGNAMVSEAHGNFLVNMGEATAADVLELEKRVVEQVKKRYEIVLEREVKLGGDYME